MKPTCPECNSTDLKYFEAKKRYSCSQCGFSFEPEEKKSQKLRIFLSYGYDANEELVRMIKADPEKRGHDVWFDKNEIKFGDDWRICDDLKQGETRRGAQLPAEFK
jgi:transcription elongation factor Elf1